MSHTTTTIVPAKPGSPFARTTVPQWLMKQLKLKHGDFLEWELDKDNHGWFVRLEPIKKETLNK